MELHQAPPLDVLRSINYIDSALFGIHIDIFKVRLLISVCQSEALEDLGFEDGNGDLCADFHQIRNLDFRISKSTFCPPFLEDGELAATDILDFNFDSIEIRKVGSTGQTDRLGEYGEMRDIHVVRFTSVQAALQFQFVAVTLSVFEPLDFHKER